MPRQQIPPVSETSCPGQHLSLGYEAFLFRDSMLPTNTANSASAKKASEVKQNFLLLLRRTEFTGSPTRCLILIYAPLKAEFYLACDAHNEISSPKANEKDSLLAISGAFIHSLQRMNLSSHNSASLIYLF